MVDKQTEFVFLIKRIAFVTFIKIYYIKQNAKLPLMLGKLHSVLFSHSFALRFWDLFYGVAHSRDDTDICSATPNSEQTTMMTWKSYNEKSSGTCETMNYFSGLVTIL